jgi:hypothetical protein
MDNYRTQMFRRIKSQIDVTYNNLHAMVKRMKKDYYAPVDWNHWWQFTCVSHFPFRGRLIRISWISLLLTSHQPGNRVLHYHDTNDIGVIGGVPPVRNNSWRLTQKQGDSCALQNGWRHVWLRGVYADSTQKFMCIDRQIPLENYQGAGQRQEEDYMYVKVAPYEDTQGFQSKIPRDVSIFEYYVELNHLLM